MQKSRTTHGPDNPTPIAPLNPGHPQSLSIIGGFPGGRRITVQIEAENGWPQGMGSGNEGRIAVVADGGPKVTVDFAPEPPLVETSRDEIKDAVRHRSSGETPQPFAQGELTFYPSRVELCGVKVCGDKASGSIRKVLDVLCGVDAQGRRRAYSGDELAAILGAEGGATAVAGIIRSFRNYVRRALLDEASILIDPISQLIVNDRRHGYRLSDNVSVTERPGLLDPPRQDTVVQPSGFIKEPEASSEDHRALWILDSLAKNGELRKRQIIERTGWSDSTVRRALAKLRDDGKIAFEGSARNGHWRLA